MVDHAEANQILIEWYLGELGGEELFTQLASVSNSAVARKWNALAEVEKAVGTRLRNVLLAQGLSLPSPADLRDRAAQRRAQIPNATWQETMSWLLSIAEKALTKMQSAAVRLPGNLSAIADLVIEHEVALISFAEFELRGDSENSLLPLHDFMVAFQDQWAEKA